MDVKKGRTDFVQSHHLPGRNEEDHENPQSR